LHVLCAHLRPKLALRSAESVLREARLLVQEMGVRNLRFMDDTFNFSPARRRRICHGLLKLQPLQWTALARLDRLDEPTVELMAHAGCRRLYVGVESGAERMLELYQKGATLAQMRHGIELIRRTGMEASAFFIVGGPTETMPTSKPACPSPKKRNSTTFSLPASNIGRAPNCSPIIKTNGNQHRAVLCRPRDVVAYDRLLELEREFYRRFYCVRVWSGGTYTG
jgi:hypothetical protein